MPGTDDTADTRALRGLLPAQRTAGSLEAAPRATSGSIKPYPATELRTFGPGLTVAPSAWTAIVATIENAGSSAIGGLVLALPDGHQLNCAVSDASHPSEAYQPQAAGVREVFAFAAQLDALPIFEWRTGTYEADPRGHRLCDVVLTLPAGHAKDLAAGRAWDARGRPMLWSVG